MDQMASSAGGLVYIDFQNDDPEVREISYDFAAKGYALVVVNSGGSHDNLTDFYAAIPQEMRAVAACFGRNLPAPRAAGAVHADGAPVARAPQECKR